MFLNNCQRQFIEFLPTNVCYHPEPRTTQSPIIHDSCQHNALDSAEQISIGRHKLLYVTFCRAVNLRTRLVKTYRTVAAKTVWKTERIAFFEVFVAIRVLPMCVLETILSVIHHAYTRLTTIIPRRARANTNLLKNVIKYKILEFYKHDTCGARTFENLPIL